MAGDDLDRDLADARASAELQAIMLGEAVLHGPLAVLVADEFMRYVAVSDAACTLLGYRREELLALRVTDVADAPIAPELYSEMLRSGSASGTTPLRRKDGTLVTFRYAAGRTRIAGMPFYVSFGLEDVGGDNSPAAGGA
jgi:PAS domain S-box-containing protein